MVKFGRFFALLSILSGVMFVSCSKQGAPAIPTFIFAPSSGTNGLAYSISVSSTDPDGDSIRIIADWGDDIADTSAFLGSGDTIEMPHSWAFADTFSIRLKALDATGSESDWSDAHTIAISIGGNAAPQAPGITGPSSGSVENEYLFISSAIDPDEDSVSVILYWGDGTNSGWSSFVYSQQGIEFFHTFIAPDTYYITAKAKDCRMAESALSDSFPIIISEAGEDRLIWSYETGGNVYSSASIGNDGTIYAGSEDSYLYALDPEGNFKWKIKTDGIVYTPAIDIQGTIYVVSTGLYAVNPNGSLKWHYSTGMYEFAAPAIGEDGSIYFGSCDGSLYAINPDGTKKWTYATGRQVNTPSVGSDGTIYVGSKDSCLYAINPAGTLKWKYKTDGWVTSSPAIGSDGTLYFGSNDGYLYALNSSGSLKWSYKTGSAIGASPAIGPDGTIYVDSKDRYLYAITSAGALKWKYYVYCQYSSPCVGSDGYVYVGASDYYLYAIKTEDGTLGWRYQTGGGIDFSSPIIGPDGTIYVGSNDYKLYAIKGTGQLASSAWPMFGHDLKHTGRAGGG